MLKFILLFLLIPVASAVSIIPQSQDTWTCYDYSTNFQKENPEWGIVTISENQNFKGFSHMVNFQVINNETLLIHDGMRETDYILSGWKYQGFYHFWDTTPIRNYIVLFDNRNTYFI